MSSSSECGLLASKILTIKNELFAEFSNDTTDKIIIKDQRTCKIIKFSSNYEFKNILIEISALDPSEYLNLFVFVIETKKLVSDESMKILKGFLNKFSQNRPIILQLSSQEENKLKIFYKEENSDNFYVVKEQKCNKAEIIDNFSKFLWYFFKENDIDNLEDSLLKTLPKAQNSSLIIKLLKIFELSNDFNDLLILKCAKSGSKSDILAAIDGFMDIHGKLQCEDLSCFYDLYFDESSILQVAVENSNADVVDLLIQNCSNLLCQLPFDHQVEISTTAYNLKHFEILCSLLEICDFPFSLEIKPEFEKNKRLIDIINSREKFHNNINAEDLPAIEEFAKNNSNLRFAYNIKNISAFCQALESQKFKALFRLKALRFEDYEVEYDESELENDKIKKKSIKFYRLQRKKNAQESSLIFNDTILQLSRRSLIYKPDKKDTIETKYKEKIMKWYIEIYKTKYGSKLLDAASQCQELRIIFDFGCYSVENVDVSQNRGSLGTTYGASKYIFIGAKLSEESNREQRIKGVVAHEICHYVMRLVYQNDEYPYFKGDKNSQDELDDVANDIKRFILHIQSDEDREYEDVKVDDECNGIISTVYACYKKDDRHPELIVRPVHIQVQFDDDAEKVEKLEQKYKKLYDYFEKYVLPVLENFSIKKRENVENLNKIGGLLSEIQQLKFQFVSPKDVTEILNNNFVIITSNVPKLLLLVIYKHIQQKYGLLYKAANIFIDPKAFKNSFIKESFDNVLLSNSGLNIFLNCSKQLQKGSYCINKASSNKFIIILSDEEEAQEFIKKHENFNLKVVEFKWNDIDAKSKELLLQTKVVFQNNENFTLFELISSQNESQDENTIEDFSDIIDGQLLNLLIEKTRININQLKEEDKSEKHFRILFRSRSLMKHFQVTEELKNPLNQNENCSDVKKNFCNNSLIELSDNQLEPDSKISKTNLDELKIITKVVNKECKITQDEMLNDVKELKIVLISDKAGSGKSWTLKNFTNILQEKYPEKWITYVDLKQFIPQFTKHNTEPEFADFMSKTILKSFKNFELKIFKKLYKNGKVCILFDGFDEIAPDCAEFVTKLFQSFQQNGGNQLWIATRDYYEVNLKERMEVKVLYKLDEFTEEHGLQLIASSWLLNEIKDNIDKKSPNDIIDAIKISQNYEPYKENANKLRKKYLDMKSSSIGLPQHYKMIADVFENNKNSEVYLTTLKVYDEFVDIQCKRWTKYKGKIRTTDSVRSHRKNFNYHQVHELVAMESLFTEDSTICNLTVKNLDWSDEEIIGCGMLIKIGEKFLFTHETFREYYAATFVIKKLPFDDRICKYFISFLSMPKYGIVRMFLNDALSEQTTVRKIELNLQTISQNFSQNAEKIENLNHVFDENLENLVEHLLQIIKGIQNYEKGKIILFKNRKIIGSGANFSKLFQKLQEFVVEFFKIDDLKDFLIDSSTFFAIVSSKLCIKVIEEFIGKVCIKTEAKFIQELLQLRDGGDENLFYSLIRSQHTSSEKLNGFFKILNKYLETDEITKMVFSFNKNGENFFHVCFYQKQVEKIELLWRQLEQFFMKQSSIQKFKEFLSEKTTQYEQNILHIAAKNETIELHEALWKLLESSIQNREELKDLIMQGDKDGDNFIHFLVIFNKPEIIEFIITKIKENFSSDQYEEILKSKGFNGRNLLQLAARYSKGIKTHQILWKIFRDLCNSDGDFLEFFKEVDTNGNDVFHLAACFTSKEIFEFMLNELEKITTNEEIKNILGTLGMANKNLLQSAAIQNKSVELHEYLWTTMTKYFNEQEILNIIKQTDEYGDNLLFNAVEWNTKEVLEMTWKKTKNVAHKNAIQGYLKAVNKEQENILHILIKSKYLEKIKFLGTELGKYLTSLQIRELLSQKTKEHEQNVLHYAATFDEIEFHVNLWEFLFKIFEDQEELKDLIMQGNKYGDNFIHFLVIYNKPEIIKFIITKIKENFSSDQNEEILKSKGQFGRNLLQLAAFLSKDIKTHQILWKIFRDFCYSDGEFLEFLKTVDNHNNNFFHLAAAFSSKEVFEFTTNELGKLASYEEIRHILGTLGFAKKNILQSAARQNKSVDFHKYLWAIMNKYFKWHKTFRVYMDRD